MTRTQLFPIILMSLDILAAIVCAIGRDWRRAIYWTAAAILTATVTF